MSDVEPSDEALMLAYVGGDATAFRRLFARHAPALLGMFRRRVRASEANDMLQLTFLHLHRARNDFKRDARLRPWLYTIATNVLREHFRKKGRRPESPLDEGVEATLVAEEGPSLETRQEAKARELKLRRALAALPDNQREVIELHWFEGRPFDEVSVILGASLSAVKVRAHRAYGRLRKLLESEL